MASQSPDSFAQLRESYGQNSPLVPTELDSGWWVLLERWIAVAAERGVREPNAMVLATVDGAGETAQPHTRTVLCKGIAPSGVRFFTTRTSRKGSQLAAQPRASVTFPMIDCERQVHLAGPVAQLDDDVSGQYWAQRPRGSQIAAWASAQSQPIASLEALDAELTAATNRFGGADGAEPVPMPPHWGGYELRPERVEFWQGGADRFHDRLVAELGGGDAADPAAWTVRRLQP